MAHTNDRKYSTIHYHSYLELDKILDAQHLRSAELQDKPAHDEMLFIIIHQAYELWFKQMIHEMRSVADMFKEDRMDEKNMGVAVHRLDRVIEIFEILIGQVRILETLTPLDFLDFRAYLFPASGFQSFQFRMVEVMMGLQAKQRVQSAPQHYLDPLLQEQQEALQQIISEGSLFVLVEKWLERTPFLEFQDFNFLEQYKKAVMEMLKTEADAIRRSAYLTDEQKEKRLEMLGSSDSYFQSVLDPEKHETLREEGKIRLSYRATLAVLLIKLYRDEPILQMPYRLITCLADIDELLSTWRYRHAQMVMRMLGRKVGTGGSAGYDYLRDTALKHQIFSDLHNTSTMLIPRSQLPPLPDHLKRQLGFYFSNQ